MRSPLGIPTEEEALGDINAALNAADEISQDDLEEIFEALDIDVSPIYHDYQPSLQKHLDSLESYLFDMGDYMKARFCYGDYERTVAGVLYRFAAEVDDEEEYLNCHVFTTNRYENFFTLSLQYDTPSNLKRHRFTHKLMSPMIKLLGDMGYDTSVKPRPLGDFVTAKMDLGSHIALNLSMDMPKAPTVFAARKLLTQEKKKGKSYLHKSSEGNAMSVIRAKRIDPTKKK